MHKAKNVQQVTLHFFLNIISEILIHVYVNHPTTEKKINKTQNHTTTIKC